KAAEPSDPGGARGSNDGGPGPMGIKPEAGRIGSAAMRFQLAQNNIQAVDRPDAPSQGQYIAPMAFRMKQRLEQNVVGFGERLFELRKPVRRNRCDGFFSRQHSRSQTINLRGVSTLCKGRRAQSLYCALPATGRPTRSTEACLRSGAIKRLRPTTYGLNRDFLTQ